VVGFTDGHVKFMRMAQHKMVKCGSTAVDLHWWVHTYDCGWDWNPAATVDWE
jgi:hypothetical protein